LLKALNRNQFATCSPSPDLAGFGEAAEKEAREGVKSKDGAKWESGETGRRREEEEEDLEEDSK